MNGKTLTIEAQLQAINHKLDAVTHELQAQARRQMELQELKDDLSKIGSEVFGVAVQELEGIGQHFDTRDLVHLGTKLLRNTRNLSQMLDQLEYAKDFLEDGGPIARKAFLDLLETLDRLDRKGYFTFFKELTRVLDSVVAGFTAEDVRLLGQNIVTILETVKGLTQPEVLRALNNALAVYQHLDVELDDRVRYRDLLREARTPEMKQGLAFGIKFLKNLTRIRSDSTVMNGPAHIHS